MTSTNGTVGDQVEGLVEALTSAASRSAANGVISKFHPWICPAVAHASASSSTARASSAPYRSSTRRRQ